MKFLPHSILLLLLSLFHGLLLAQSPTKIIDARTQEKLIEVALEGDDWQQGQGLHFHILVCDDNPSFDFAIFVKGKHKLKVVPTTGSSFIMPFGPKGSPKEDQTHLGSFQVRLEHRIKYDKEEGMGRNPANPIGSGVVVMKVTDPQNGRQWDVTFMVKCWLYKEGAKYPEFGLE